MVYNSFQSIFKLSSVITGLSTLTGKNASKVSQEKITKQLAGYQGDIFDTGYSD